MVRKFNDGNYVLLTIEADGAGVLELERRLRVTEPVIKFITVRIDEEEKRLAKVKALRGVRRKVSAEPQLRRQHPCSPGGMLPRRRKLPSPFRLPSNGIFVHRRRLPHFSGTGRGPIQSSAAPGWARRKRRE